MLLTVAICTWNRAAVLDRTLAHLRTLRVPAGCDWELLVVNNNCTDDTDAVIARHADQLPVHRAFEPTPGISFARNAAARAARGGLLLWTDDDALPEPDWAEQLLAAFDRFGADLVFGKVVPHGEAGRPPPWFTPAFNGMYALLDLGGDARVLTDPRFVGHNVNLAFRRGLLDQLGGYREDLGVGRTGGAEDIDLCQRAYAAGRTVVYQPAAVVRHVIPAGRCTKRFVRRHVLNGTPHHLKLLREEAKGVPSLCGLPRYFFRLHLRYAREWAAGVFAGDRGRAFYHEMKFLRLTALARAMLTERRAE